MMQEKLLMIGILNFLNGYNLIDLKTKQIGEGGFAKVYSETWIDGNAKYDKQNDGSWKKQESDLSKLL
jgi:hypothetical protein